MSRSNSRHSTRRQTGRKWRTAIPFALLCLACLGYVVYTFQANRALKQVASTADIANHQAAVSVPFAGGLPANALVLVEARINGKGPYVFKLDTGAQFSSLDHKIGDPLEPSTLAKSHSPKASSDLAQTPAVTVDTVEIGTAHLRHFMMNVAEMPEEPLYDGILGMDLCEHFVVSIDYERRRVSLTVPDKFSYTGSGDVFPFELSEKGTPLITGTLGTTQTHLEVNTGQETAVEVFQDYVRTNSMKERYPNYVEYHSGGKSVETRETLAFVHILAMTLSENIRVSYPIIAMSDRASPVPGALGNFFLQQFTVTLDERNQQVILEKNHLYEHPFPSNRAGFLLEPTQDKQDKIVVSDVVDNSPASEAGLQADDQIITLAGHPIKTLNRFAWNVLLDGAPATKLPLTVQRDGKTLSFLLKLRDLL